MVELAPGGTPGRAGHHRRQLVAARLAALVDGQWGRAARERASFPSGAALLGTVAGGGRAAWVTAAESSDHLLGPALVWAESRDVEELHLIAEGTGPTDRDDAGDGPDRGLAGDAASGAAGVLARQAAWFGSHAPSVWRVEGPSLVRAEPAPLPRPRPAPTPTDLVDLLIDAGLEVVVEGGMVRGELNGLEVARIVHGTTSAGEPIDEPRLEVGVGKADRELTATVHAALPPAERLRRVVDIVAAHRRPGAPRHPLNQLVPERWLRAVLCRAPAAVGLASLRPAEGARPRPDLTRRDVAIATGATPDGAPVVVACSVGVALDLVPTAADARELLDPGSRLLLAVPERDDHPGTRRLAARLDRPATVVPVAGDWRRAG
ncbi:MAG TPA: hypothetical protein VFZ68_11655 [Acidimicrobiales bacterium]